MRQQLIINNQSIEVMVKGEGKQTIVILPGMLCSFDEWLPIIETLSTHNRVISFHRPGYGKSDLGNGEKTTRHVTSILVELLNKLNVNNPIVLIGHSYGGLCAQHFMKLYPEKVHSVVLVDSTSVNLHRLDELELPISNEINSDEHWISLCHRYAKMNHKQLMKELNPTLSPYQQKLPLESQKYLLEFITSPSAYEAMMLELQTWKECAKAIKREQVNFDKPLRVISRDPMHSIRESIEEGIPMDEAILIEKVWEELIQEQLDLSSYSKLIIAQNSGHSIHIDNPDIILNVVKEIISASSC